jgi:hypothetical protein
MDHQREYKPLSENGPNFKTPCPPSKYNLSKAGASITRFKGSLPELSEAYLTNQFGLLSTSLLDGKTQNTLLVSPPYIWNWGLVGGTVTVAT